MSLRRFTDGRRLRWRAAFVLLAAAAFAGCASGPVAPADEAVGAAGQVTVPPEVKTEFERAAVAMAAGETDEAERRFRTFVERHAGYPGAHVNLAIIMTDRGDDEAAEEEISAALAVDPENPQALNQLGMLRRRQGDFLEAESAYLKAVTASPEYALAHYNLGVLNELYLQRLDDALRCYERYLELGGDDERVARWIADLKRRLATNQSTAQAREQR